MEGGGGEGVEEGVVRDEEGAVEPETGEALRRTEESRGRDQRAGRCRRNCRGSFKSWRKRFALSAAVVLVVFFGRQTRGGCC